MRIRGINIPVPQHWLRMPVRYRRGMSFLKISLGSTELVVTGGPGGGPRAGHQHGADQAEGLQRHHQPQQHHHRRQHGLRDELLCKLSTIFCSFHKLLLFFIILNCSFLFRLWILHLLWELLVGVFPRWMFYLLFNIHDLLILCSV